MSCYCIRLKPFDIEFMKQLHQKVNIVPIIAKADVLTKKEVADLKKRVKIKVTYYILWRSLVNFILYFNLD